MYYLMFVSFATSIGLSWWLALATYIPINRPLLFFVPSIGISFMFALLAHKKNPQKKKAIWRFAIATALLVCSAFGVNALRYRELNRSYLSHDTPFNSAAQEVMPELSRLSLAGSVEHHHGNRFGDEWVVVKAVFSPEDFAKQRSQIETSYTFYPPGEITNAPFSACTTPFPLENYQFSILKLQAYENQRFSNYGAVIGFNEEESSILYLFIDSDITSSMSMDDIVGGVWDFLGVSK